MKKILVLFAVVIVGCASPKNIGKDKYYHAAAGAATEVVGEKLKLPPTASSFAIGFTKEVYDYIDYGRFDVKDLLATWIGGIIVRHIIKNKNEKENNKSNR